MKAFKKNILVFVSIVCILWSLGGFNVFASEKDSTDTPSLYYQVCAMCGGRMATKTIVGSEKYEGKSPCIHQPYGYDDVYSTTTTQEHRCGECGAGYDTHNTAKRYVCHGYDY